MRYYDEGYNEERDEYEQEQQWEDGVHDPLHICFANKGSALRCSSPTNPRNLSCPTCGEPNRLTPADVALGYQCDICADRDERGFY